MSIDFENFENVPSSQIVELMKAIEDSITGVSFGPAFDFHNGLNAILESRKLTDKNTPKERGEVNE